MRHLDSFVSIESNAAKLTPLVSAAPHSFARFAGSSIDLGSVLGLGAQGFMLAPASRARRLILVFRPAAGTPGSTLSPASRARDFNLAWSWGWRPRLYAFTRFAGSSIDSGVPSWGWRPRLYAFTRFAGSRFSNLAGSWGWRPRLYAFARFAGSSILESRLVLGLGAPGFMLAPASRARRLIPAFRPGAGCPGRMLSPASRARRFWNLAWSWGWRPRLYAVTRFAGSSIDFWCSVLRLAPQALRFQPLRGLAIFESRWFRGLAPQALCFRPLRGLVD